MDVKYVADLARIKLSSEQIKKLDTQFKAMLSFFKNLEELETKNIEPCSHVLPLKNVFREDIVKSSLNVGEVIKNAPQKAKGFIKVPRVIKE